MASFVADVAGAYRVRFMVSEDDPEQCGPDFTDHAEDTLFVQAVDIQADAGPDQFVDVSGTVELDGNNSIGNNLSYTWTRLFQLGTSAAPAGGAGPVLSFPLDEPDSLEYELEVDDGAGKTDTDTVIVVSNGPAITLLTPDMGPVGTRVTIAGSNFHPTASENAVTFGGVAAPVISATSSTELQADVPAGATTGSVSVTVSPTGHSVTGPTFTVTTGAGTWTLVPSMVTNGLLVDVSFPTSMTGYAVGQSAAQLPVVTKSTDGGASWTLATAPAGLASSRLLGASFTHPDTGTVVGQFDQIFRTEDGGVTWTQQSAAVMNATWADVSFSDAQNGVAVGLSLTVGGGVMARTTDGGATQWAAVPVGSQNLHAVHMVSANEGWTVGFGGVILHTTNGTTWNLQGTPTGVATLNDVFFIDAMNGWAVGSLNAGGPVVIATSDGGANWSLTATQPTGTSPLTGVSFTDAMTGVVVGNGGIFRTVDGGANWIDESGSAGPVRVDMTSATTGIAVGGPNAGTTDAAIWRRQ